MNIHSQWTVAPESVKNDRRCVGWSNKKQLRLTLLALFLLQASVPCVRAQIAASIKRTVSDNARNLETRATRNTTTAEAGRSLVLSLPVGEYEVKVAKPDFPEAIRTEIRSVVGQEAIVDLTLQASVVKAEVRVSGDAPLASTTTQDISGLVGEQQIRTFL